MHTVDFYYAIGSRYSYLASTQIAALELETGCRVEWHPIDNASLLAKRGRGPYEGEPVSGQYDWAYRELDAMRWAGYYGVPFVEPRGRVQFDPKLIAHACTAAKRLGQGMAFGRELFAAMFVDPLTLIDEAECLQRARKCGITGSGFQGELWSIDTAAQLEATIEQAYRVGVFGVPTFVAGHELFWGNDRIVLLRNYLSPEQKPGGWHIC